MKTCFKCLRALPLDDFYVHRQMADGHLGKCKECTKADTHRRSLEKRAELARYDRERNQRPERKAQRAETQRKHRARHRDHVRARNTVAVAVNAGRIVPQPCAVCGATKTEAHHDDYSKPLDVRWLCQRHHFNAHGKEPRA